MTFVDLHPHIKEMLEHLEFLTFDQLMQPKSVVENRRQDTREFHNSHLPNMHAIEYYLDIYSSNDKPKDYFVAEFLRLAQAKSDFCFSLKPIHSNQEERKKFTFDVSKCNRIFYATC